MVGDWQASFRKLGKLTRGRKIHHLQELGGPLLPPPQVLATRRFGSLRSWRNKSPFVSQGKDFFLQARVK